METCVQQKKDNPVVFVCKFIAAFGVALWTLVTIPFTLKTPRVDAETEGLNIPKAAIPVPLTDEEMADLNAYEPNREVLCDKEEEEPQKARDFSISGKEKASVDISDVFISIAGGMVGACDLFDSKGNMNLFDKQIIPRKKNK